MKTCVKCSSLFAKKNCPVCAKAINKAWRMANKDILKEKKRVYYEKNKDSVIAASLAWAKSNPERRKANLALYYITHKESMNAVSREWRLNNPDRHLESSNSWKSANLYRVKQNQLRWRLSNKDHAAKYNLDYQRKNSEKYSAIKARRRASKLQATPLWADDVAIAGFYELAARRTEETGVMHTVDHVIPLRSKLVCGLHCESNLAVLTAAANTAKGNRHWPDMP